MEVLNNFSVGVEFVLSNSSNYTNTSHTEYEYHALSEPPLEELIPVSIIYGITLVLGMLGNILVIFSVTRYQQMLTVTNTFLLSLASADLLLVIICVPVKFAAFFSYVWRFGEFLCKTVHYVQNVSTICSVATLTFMSLERYYAIVHPMKAKYSCTVGKARRACIFLWVLSFILALPILIGRVHITVGLYRKATWCIKEWKNPTYSILYEIYMFCIILAFPVLIMSFAYIRICQELWFMSQHRSIMRNDSRLSCISKISNSKSQQVTALKVKFVDDDNTKRQVIKMLVAIILIFVICWAPITVNNLLVAFKILPGLHIGSVKYMREAFHIMSYANSCVNPIVYGFMSKNFRQTFVKSLCGCLRGKEYIRRQVFKSQTEVSYMTEDAYPARWTTQEQKGMLSNQSTIDEDFIDIDDNKECSENVLSTGM
ncbi:QRFP-like peptide receptor [Ruditapes philippinarum]|uniref:QRFP-like peptide receptor n=1 Tax=Ruditapes philippinarum TaxID=129788 RepID=UPI00295AB9C8|nr:QRFP-like peptide receptor [Ruditapes philippinarum]